MPDDQLQSDTESRLKPDAVQNDRGHLNATTGAAEPRISTPDRQPSPKDLARQVVQIVREKLAESSSDAQQTSIQEQASQPQDPIPARMLNEFVYCARLFYYEFVEGVFVENADTQRGSNLHQRVDSGTGALPDASTQQTSSPASTNNPSIQSSNNPNVSSTDEV